MKTGSFWRLLFISCLSLLMVACKPSAEFTVSPTPVTAGAAASFDASDTTIYNTSKGNAAVSYSWAFGDGSTGSGQVATHTYAAPGTYNVTLAVKDKAGQTGTVSHAVVVQASTATAPVQVMVQLAGGVSLPGATVRVGTATATSDASGLASLAAAPVGADQVVTVSKEGYVTQVVRATLVADNPAQKVLVLLLPVKDTMRIADVAAAQTLKANQLGASVTLPTNALVNAATGAPATGPATLQLTPWDISGIDLQAMPGNGRALDSAGQLVDLISAGMMTVDFFDAAGNKLQLATGQSATIRMDLPAGTTHIGDTPVTVGSSIPLWHFDEARGLWIGEGSGTVVATETGLAVSATVQHFSTWNWDYVTRPIVGGGGTGVSSGMPTTTPTLTVSCQDASETLTACNVVAKITYSNGFVRFWGSSLPAAVSPIYNMPAGATIHWEATTPDGLKGTADSASTGNVVIRIQPPSTRNFVRCLAPDGVATGCSVVMTTLLSDSTTSTLHVYIPDTGAVVQTTEPTVGPLRWSALTNYTHNGDGTWVRYRGVATSGVTGTVDIALTADVVSTGKTVYFSCLPNANTSTGASVPLASCELSITVYNGDESIISSITVPSGLGAPTAVQLPALEDGAFVQVSAWGAPTEPTVQENFYGDFYAPLSTLAAGQSIALELSGVVPSLP